jgi:hypothetical protein
MIAASFYEGAFGRRAVNKEEPMTIDSVFRIASMTKAAPVRLPCSWLKKIVSVLSNRWVRYCL